jgi:polar amino acid transport system permease protein
MSGAFNINHCHYLLLGAAWTLGLSLLSILAGGIAGFAVALSRISPVAPVRWLATGYVQLVQGTPLLILMFLSYFGLTVAGFNVPAIVAATLAMTIYVSAYIGEIWRGCIQSVTAHAG